MIIESHISYGYVELLKTFFVANNLSVVCQERVTGRIDQTNFIYEDDSETALALTFMGMKHLGIENMLCDYLIRCGMDRTQLAYGRPAVKRDMKKLDEEWDKYRKTIGV
jgi:hypothetical protein